MIFDQDLPKFLWGEEAMKTIYIQIGSPHIILGNMTPEEAFSWKNPCVDHLEIFGFHAYIHIPKYKRTKLDSTIIKDIFIDYNLSSKAYKIYIEEER